MLFVVNLLVFCIGVRRNFGNSMLMRVGLCGGVLPVYEFFTHA